MRSMGHELEKLRSSRSSPSPMCGPKCSIIWKPLGKISQIGSSRTSRGPDQTLRGQTDLFGKDECVGRVWGVKGHTVQDGNLMMGQKEKGIS